MSPFLYLHYPLGRTMKVSIEISMYPLKEDYRQPIREFIDTLEKQDTFTTIRNSMSTTLIGNYQAIMPVLNQAMESSLKDLPESVFVIKLSSGCL